MDNKLVEILEENIFLEFFLNNKKYAVISNSEEIEEGDEIYFSIVDEFDGIKIMRNINSDEEYQNVTKKFEKILNIYKEEEE